MAGTVPVGSGSGRGVRHRLEAGIVYGLELVVRLLPLPAVRSVGAMLGRLVYYLDGFHRRIALTNLELALPSKPNPPTLPEAASRAVRPLLSLANRFAPLSV